MVKNIIKKISALFLFLCISSSLFSLQNYKFKRISVDEGLSQGNVNCMVQDKHGFMWFGTKDGLNRYDGYSFKIYKPNDSIPGSLSHNNIWALFVDRDSVLWVGTDGGGLNRYDRASDSFTSYNHKENDPFSLCHNSVYAIYEDKLGYLWVGTFGGGVSVMDKKTGRFIEHYKNDPTKRSSLSANKIRVIFEDLEGELWIGADEYTYGGLNKFDRKKKQFVRYQHDPNNPNTIGSNIVLDVLVDKDSTFWLGSWAAGISHYNPRTKENKVYKHDPNDPNSISSNETFSFCRDRKGRLWVTTRNGLDMYDEEIDGFVHFKNDPLIPTTITQDIVISLYEDVFGVLWIGFEGGGLCTYDTEAKQFEHYVRDYKNPNSLINNNVTAFLEDKKGNIWVGTSGAGISIFNLKTDNVTQLRHIPDNPNSLGHYNVNYIFEDSKGIIWIGYNGGGLDRYDPETAMFKHYTEEEGVENSLSNNSIFCIDEDPDGNIWLGTYGGGINRFDPVTEKFYNYPIDTENDMNDVAWTLLVDSDGLLWVGSGGHGLLYYEKSADKFIYYKKDENANSISHNVVMDLAEDQNGYLWIGTGGAGIDRLDTKTMEFKNFSSKNGLVNDMVSSIVIDEFNTLWVATIKGLSKFEFRDSVTYIKNFDKFDGLQDNSFNPHSKLLSKNGHVYLGGVNGFNRFYPSKIVDNRSKPLITLTDFSIFAESQGPRVEGSKIDKAIWEVDEIDLSYTDYSFAFEFAAIHFAAPSKNSYEYKMEGFDEDWMSTTADRRYASYTNLPGGEYYFKVRAKNSDGVPAAEELSVKINISSPYYKTFWFWAIVVVVITLLVFAYIRYRESEAKKQRIILEQKVHEAVSELEKQKEEIIHQNQELQKRKEQDELQNWYTSGLADFGEILRKNKDDLNSLGNDILESLVNYIGAIQGGLFVLNDEDLYDKHLQLVSSFGYDSASYSRKRLEIGEGLVGTCFKDKEVKHLTEFPDNYLKIYSGLGECTAKELLIVPLKLDELIYGVVEIASLKGFRPIDIKFVEKLGESITSTIFTAKISIKTNYLLEQSRQQAEELKAQEEETRQNIEEMQANREEALRIKSEVTGYMNSVNHTVIRGDFNLEGELEYANTKFLDLMGYSSKEAYKMNVLDFFFNEEREAFEERWSELVNGGHHIEEYFTHKTKDSSIKLLSTFTSVKDVNGLIVKILYLGLSVEGGIPQKNSASGYSMVDKFLMRVELDADGAIIMANNLFVKFLSLEDRDIHELMFDSLLNESKHVEFDEKFESLIETKKPFYLEIIRPDENGDKVVKHLYFDIAINDIGDIIKIIAIEVNSDDIDSIE